MDSFLKLVPAIVLGSLAGALYWWGVQESIKPEKINLVGITRQLDAGQPFGPSAIKEVPLNFLGGRAALEQLRKAAVPFEDASLLYGRTVNRSLQPGDLVLYRDIDPVPEGIAAGEGEVVLPISLEGISIEPQLLYVGDEVEFLAVEPPNSAAPTSITGDPDVLIDEADEILSTAGDEAILAVGPFRILSVGSRLATRETNLLRSGPGGRARGTTGNERVITVALKRLGDGKGFEQESRRLIELLAARDQGDRRTLMLVLHPPRRPAPAPAPAVEEEIDPSDAGAPSDELEYLPGDDLGAEMSPEEEPVADDSEAP